MKTINLKEGVDLHIIDASKFKTNLLSIYFNFPIKRETVTKAAIIPSILKRGLKSYPTLKDISRHLDDLYSTNLIGGIRSKGDGESMFFSLEYVADKFIGESLTEKVTEFLKELIFSPLTEGNGFMPSYVESEKVNLRNAIESLINDKKEYTEVKCREAMFKDSGSGISEMGYVEDIDSLTPQNLYEFYQEILNTSKIDIFISGSITDTMVDDVKKVLLPCLSSRNADYVKSEIALYRDGDAQRITEDADVVQSKLCMGLICGTEPTSKDYEALVLASCIYGGSPFSKLFVNVREKLSLAYYAMARTSRFKSYMMISSGIQTENFQKAYDEIMLQLEKMQKGEIEDSEIDAAKKFLTNAYTSMNDRLYGMEDYYYSQAILGLNQSTEELLNNILKVNKEDIVAVMKKIKLDTVYFLKGRTEGA